MIANSNQPISYTPQNLQSPQQNWLEILKKNWKAAAFGGFCLVLVIWALILRSVTPKNVPSEGLPQATITPYFQSPTLTVNIPKIDLPAKLTPYAFAMTTIDTNLAKNMASILGFIDPPTTIIPEPETIYIWNQDTASLSINQTNPKIYLEDTNLLNNPVKKGNFNLDQDTKKITDIIGKLSIFDSVVNLGTPQITYHHTQDNDLSVVPADQADFVSISFNPTLNNYPIRTFPRPVVQSFFDRNNNLARLEILPWFAKVAAYKDMDTIPQAEINSRALTQATPVDINNNKTVDESMKLPTIDKANLSGAQIIYHPNTDTGILEPMLQLTGKADFDKQTADISYLMPVLTNSGYQATSSATGL